VEHGEAQIRPRVGRVLDAGEVKGALRDVPLALAKVALAITKGALDAIHGRSRADAVEQPRQVASLHIDARGHARSPRAGAERASRRFDAISTEGRGERRPLAT
jgi:hypothetical protein